MLIRCAINRILHPHIYKKVRKFCEVSKGSGFYMDSFGIVGDAYGPMGPGRYTSFVDFYRYYRQDIDEVCSEN